MKAPPGLPAVDTVEARSVPIRIAGVRRGGEAAAFGVIGLLGGFVAVLGWTDIALNFFPPALGNADWEFGTVSVAVDSLPLGTLGVGLAVAGAVARGRRWLLRVLAMVAWLAAAVLVGLGALYLLSLPVVWKAVAPALQGPLTLAVGKTMATAMVYLALYLALGVTSWRRSKDPADRMDRDG